MYKLKMELRMEGKSVAEGNLTKNIAHWIDEANEVRSSPFDPCLTRQEGVKMKVVLDLVAADVLKLHESLKLDKKTN